MLGPNKKSAVLWEVAALIVQHRAVCLHVHVSCLSIFISYLLHSLCVSASCPAGPEQWSLKFSMLQKRLGTITRTLSQVMFCVCVPVHCPSIIPCKPLSNHYLKATTQDSLSCHFSFDSSTTCLTQTCCQYLWMHQSRKEKRALQSLKMYLQLCRRTPGWGVTIIQKTINIFLNMPQPFSRSRNAWLFSVAVVSITHTFCP